MWLFLRLKISSFEYSGRSFGRMIKILVRDKSSEKYVGVVSLGSDIDCTMVDNYIGWNGKLKYDQKKFNHLMNITTCIGIPPFSFNYNGGKLMAMLMFSKEVYEYVTKKYKDVLVCITTFSLYGKSIQYDRLNELKYLGLTEGTSTSQYPVWINDCVKKYLSQMDDNKKFKSRLHKFTWLVNKYNFPKEILSGIKKGLYIGFTADLEHCKKFLTGEINKFIPSKNIKSVKNIYEFWKERWANGRFENLLNTNRIMLDCYYDTTIIDVKDYNRIKKLKTKKNIENETDKLTNDEKIEIIKYYNKNKLISMAKLQKHFSEKMNKNVDRRTISKLIYCK
jgi:hypothetical protein